MLDLNKDIIPLFPMGIYKGTLPQNLSSVVPFLDSLPMFTENDTNDYGSRSRDSYILNLSECEELSKYILKKVSEYAQKILHLNPKDYKFSQSWISHKSPGQYHTKHFHPNSIISGVMYYGSYTPNTPSICFARPTSKDTTKPQLWVSEKLEIPDNNYAAREICFNVNSGELILFPSHMEHYVPKNETPYIRKSLAFNCVPQNGFGEEIDLTQLKF